MRGGWETRRGNSGGEVRAFGVRFSFVRSFSRFYRVSFSLFPFSSTDASFVSLFSSSKSLRGGEMEASESDRRFLGGRRARRGRG